MKLLYYHQLNCPMQFSSIILKCFKVHVSDFMLYKYTLDVLFIIISFQTKNKKRHKESKEFKELNFRSTNIHLRMPEKKRKVYYDIALLYRLLTINYGLFFAVYTDSLCYLVSTLFSIYTWLIRPRTMDAKWKNWKVQYIYSTQRESSLTNCLY